VFVGQRAEAVGFDEESAAGFDGEGGEAGFGAGFEGEGADDGDVEAEVLVGFGNFDGDGLAAAQEGAAFDGFVGAFEAFDGEDGAVADDDGLSDVEAAHFFGDAEAEGDVVVDAAAGFGSGEVSGGGEKFVEEGGGGEEFDTFLGEGVAHRAEEGLGVALFEFGQKQQRGEIGAQVEEVLWCDLSGHDHLFRAGFFGVGDEFSELADLEPAQAIDFPGESGVGFVLEGGGKKASDTGAAGGGGELERVASVPCNDEKRVGRAQRAGLSEAEQRSASVFSLCWSVSGKSRGLARAAKSAGFAYV